LSVPRSSPRLTSPRTRVALGTIALIAFALCFARVGSFLAKEDGLQMADAIAVLAGTRMDRPLEALDLYRQGYAPRIVLTRNTREGSLDTLEAQGVTFPADAEETRDVFIRLGLPPSAVILPARVHDNTAQEALTLRELAQKNGWHRLIVVTSRYHLRRAGFAIRRELQGTGVEVEMRGTRYESVNPDRWWSTRADLRWVLDESAKLIAYWLGLGT
jgi:uncharacterized SAM-binding protein YcdF (DUF218 family)